MKTRLLLFFSDGISLQTWQNVGGLLREVALYQGLESNGISVGFVTYGDRGDMKFKDKLPFIDIYCNTMNVPQNWYKKKLQWLPPRADIVKSNQILGATIALKAARRSGARFLARCGYLLSEFEEKREGSDSLKTRNASQTEEFVFRDADAIELTTQAAANIVTQKYGIDSRKIHVIPNYVEVQKFTPEPKKKNAQHRILAIGRLEPQKNFGTLIRAIAPLDIQLLIIGDGAERNDLEKEARGARAEIQFLGNVPNSELPRLLNESDLFVMPSLYEGHPKALLEAMACGLPVIGTRVSGIRELIRDGENGLLCETDPETIQQTVERMLNDKPLRGKLGSSARRYVVEHFSLDHILELEMSLIHELMTGIYAIH